MLSFYSEKNYHELLCSGHTTCGEAVSFYLQKIKKNAYLNVFLEIFEEEALQRAYQLDDERKANGIQGKLHGVVVGIKDVICCKGYKVSASSKVLENFTAAYNATAVEKLLQEGAIIIGRQNCDEFAMGGSNENSAFGNVLNAADNTRVPGGSSGGSAVSVQAGLCMLSLGSDTGGSVRQPADFCGIIGLKPTYGRVSRHGLIAYASSFDQIGIFGNTIEDVALCLEVIAGPDEFDSTVYDEPAEKYSELISQSFPQKKYKIAYFRETLEHPRLNKEIRSAIYHYIDILKNDGHTVDLVEFDLLDYIVPAYYILTTAEASSNLSRYDGIRYGNAAAGDNLKLDKLYKKNRSSNFGQEVKRRIMLGSFVLSEGYYDAYFTKAQQVRKILVEKTRQIFSEYDAIISPVSPTTAFKIGEIKDPVEMYLADIYTVFANLTGIPAISFPLFIHKNGMPFGIQAMVSRFNELSLLRIAKQLIALKP